MFSVNNFSDPRHCNSEVFLAAIHPKKHAGRKKFRETRHPVYRGVRRRDSGKWGKKSACLNFADSAWRLPVPATVDARDIQKAAAEAFRPVTESETDDGRKDESASTAVLATETVTEQQDVDEVEEAVPEFLRNMLLMSPTHCWGRLIEQCPY
ncbi:CRT/DRE binding factor 4 [Sesbania bispinosa]|nr:CRT/DRE binding factor 4 [Sesbania bispinosa]